MASAPLWSLHVCQEVSLLGNFAPLLHLNYAHREAEKMSQWLRELAVLTAKLTFPVPRLGSSQLLIIPAPKDLTLSLISKVAHSCNPRAGRNEAHELQVWDKPELHISVPFPKLKKNKKLLSLGASFIKRCSLLVASKFWFLTVRAGIKYLYLLLPGLLCLDLCPLHQSLHKCSLLSFNRFGMQNLVITM